jgi:Crinkler effector protein N-terminal domain
MDTVIGMPWALLSLWIKSKLDAVHCPISCDHNLQTMSNIFEINCWVIGDDPRHVIPVKIAGSETIGYLKEVIKEKIKHSFADFDAKSLDLWKVSNDEFIFLKVDIDLTTNSDLLKSIKVEGEIPDGKELKPWSRLSKLFADGVEDEHLHIVVQRPAGRNLSTVISYSLLTFVTARYRHFKTRSREFTLRGRGRYNHRDG